MTKAFKINLAIGVWFFGLFYLVMFGLNDWKTTGMVDFPQHLVPLMATLIVFAYVTAPLNKVFEKCPRCGVLAVTALQAYVGFTAIALYVDVDVLRYYGFVQLLLNPLRLAVYTGYFTLPIAILAACVFSKKFQQGGLT